MGTIANGKNRPINVQTGTVPDVSGAMRDWFQLMTFFILGKDTEAFQLIEAADQINFFGVIQPFGPRQLQLKPEGQRAWTWFTLHADPVLTLQVDDVVSYLGVQTRVMARKDYTLYGYVEYELVQDWRGSGPAPFPSDIDGGQADTLNYEFDFDGGQSDTIDFDINLDGGGAFAG